MRSLPLHGLRVLVSGAGVAGPALAYWLTRHGAGTTVVEVAPELRSSGFAVDFRGPSHLGVLSKMGVLDELRAVQTHGGAMSFVDEDDREKYRLPVEFAGGEVEVLRRDLSRILCEHSADRAEYLFGDKIVSLADAPDGVHVDFAHAPSRTVDLVVGADGVHSGVRRLAFGAEARFVRHLNYYIAGWDVPAKPWYETTAHLYNVPGRMVSVSADLRDPERAGAMAVFASPPLDYDREDLDQQKKLVADALHGLGWRVPELVAGLDDAPDLYFDAICRVRVPEYTTGRVALLGDAGWGVTLGGMGVGTGVVGGYILAGELAAAGGDHRVAFPAYQRWMAHYVGRWQRGASPGTFLAPSSGIGLRLRDAMFGRKLVQRMMVGGSNKLATEERLPDYPG